MKNRKRSRQGTSKGPLNKKETEILPNNEESPSKSKYFKLSSIDDNSDKNEATSSSKPTDTTTEQSDSIKTVKEDSDRRLKREFYNKPCEDLAKALLGQTLVRVLDSGEVLKAKIVETEAYLGTEDKAAHSYKGKKTDRNSAMFMQPGTGYVYHIYGMYTCMNISSQGEGAAVLLRAVEPLEGSVTMKKQRSLKKAENSKPLKDKEIGNGPSKLTQAMSIDKPSVNQKDLTNDKHTWVEPGETVEANQIVCCARIGINYAEEWVHKKLRFYIIGNNNVSVRNKLAEKELTET